ncbi:MAG: T9SS type A sorting domain-containing protein [Ignavibacteriales bacterium]|nr:T9SS type A sorting domain-containing protein [Ignavibacteriales bacterium]
MVSKLREKVFKMKNENQMKNGQKLVLLKDMVIAILQKKYSFVDATVNGGSNFAYRLKQVDIDGSYEYSDVVEVQVVPTKFALDQNYPNPFNPTTKINYSVPSKSLISLTVFDVLGKEVVKLVNEIQDAGVYEASFDASQFTSGIYFYSLHAGEFTQTKKMMLVK